MASAWAMISVASPYIMTDIAEILNLPGASPKTPIIDLPQSSRYIRVLDLGTP